MSGYLMYDGHTFVPWPPLRTPEQTDEPLTAELPEGGECEVCEDAAHEAGERPEDGDDPR